MKEKIYDEEIAPKLLEIANLCEKHEIPFLAVAEWAPNEIGRTSVQVPDEGIEMVMIRHCAKTAPNIDSYFIGISRWCKKVGADTSASIVMRRLVKDSDSYDDEPG